MVLVARYLNGHMKDPIKLRQIWRDGAAAFVCDFPDWAGTTLATGSTSEFAGIFTYWSNYDPELWGLDQIYRSWEQELSVACEGHLESNHTDRIDLWLGGHHLLDSENVSVIGGLTTDRPRLRAISEQAEQWLAEAGSTITGGITLWFDRERFVTFFYHHTSVLRQNVKNALTPPFVLEWYDLLSELSVLESEEPLILRSVPDFDH